MSLTKYKDEPIIARTSIKGTNLEDVDQEDIGKVAIFCLYGPTMVIGNTVEDAIAEFNAIAGTDDQISVEDLTEHCIMIPITLRQGICAM